MASVLIVESDPGFRVYAQVVFRDAGHRVTCVGDADEALAMLATDRFDVALVAGLTDGRALDVVRARAEQAIAARTRVVLHTDDPAQLADLDRMDLGVDVLTKPARPAELLAMTSLGSGLELV